MRKIFCDVCEKEIDEVCPDSLKLVSIHPELSVRIHFTPVNNSADISTELDICVPCAVETASRELKDFEEDYLQNHVNEPIVDSSSEEIAFVNKGTNLTEDFDDDIPF